MLKGVSSVGLGGGCAGNGTNHSDKFQLSFEGVVSESQFRWVRQTASRLSVFRYRSTS